jgi:hypothetical protein
VLSVGQAFEEAVGGVQDGKRYLRLVDEGRQAFAVTLAGLAEEDRGDAAAGV